jgi:hypothetical protein
MRSNLGEGGLSPATAWAWLVKKVSADGFLYISAQFFPGIALCKDVVAEALSYESTIFFLVYAEDDFHRLNSGSSKRGLQGAFVNERHTSLSRRSDAVRSGSAGRKILGDFQFRYSLPMVNCWASALGGCSSEQSGEHYISHRSFLIP